MQTEELLSAPQTCWWNAFGSPSLTTESLADDASDSFGGVMESTPETEQVVDKLGSATLFTFSSGGGKSSRDIPKPHVAFSMQSACFEFGFSQPTIFTNNPHVAQYYGVVSAYGPQKLSSGRVMLPLNMETEEDGAIYVNSKQYHGIIRRRQSRAKAVLKNKHSRYRKPYMHPSRHLHAMRRPRGSGGRFLSTKKVDAAKQSKPSNYQSSEVFHSQNGTMSSSREADMPNLSGSQVTSMDYFLGSSVHSLERMVMPSKWIAAAMDIDCCNLST